MSSDQRLPNGNTLITEGSGGRLIEVTRDHRIIWEYISPPFGHQSARFNIICPAYRLPYEWIPQLDPPKEAPVEPVGDFDVWAGTFMRIPAGIKHQPHDIEGDIVAFDIFLPHLF